MPKCSWLVRSVLDRQKVSVYVKQCSGFAEIVCGIRSCSGVDCKHVNIRSV